jgi:hypothetical protein
LVSAEADNAAISTTSRDERITWSARRCGRVFWSWLVLRTLGWTALVALTQPNAPLDLIEWLSWGHEWRWGYHKHPPLPAWLAECFSQLTPGSMWGVYLAAYLTTALALWAVWRLGREMASPPLALLSALCLDGVIFFTYDAAEFSNNVVLNGCWAVIVLCAHRAWRTDRLRWWLGLGVAIGAALLTKYTIGILLVCLLAFTLVNAVARRRWARPGPYLALLMALLVFAPHGLWMIRNHFITIHYAFDRSAGEAHRFNHLRNPLLFALSQVGRLLPLFFILLPLTTWQWRKREAAPRERFDRSFLLFAALGPVALLLVLSLTFGMQLREIWGYPLWTFVGLLMLVCLRLDESKRAFGRALACWGVIVVLFTGYTVGKNYLEPALLHVPKRIHFPGKILADEVTQLWSLRYPTPFPIVAGDCWLSGNIGCYARHRPSTYVSPGLDYLELDPQLTPWTNDEDLCRRGGVLVWNAERYGDDLPLLFRIRFPSAAAQPPLRLPYSCGANLPPVRVGLAFVPPPAVRP